LAAGAVLHQVGFEPTAFQLEVFNFNQDSTLISTMNFWYASVGCLFFFIFLLQTKTGYNNQSWHGFDTYPGMSWT